MSIKNIFPRKENKEPWQITASRFCVDFSEKGFTQTDLKVFIQSKYSVSDRHCQQFFEEEIMQPSGRQYARSGNLTQDNKWIPPLELASKITDYDELKEARKNSKTAFWLSLISILIALLSLASNLSFCT